MNEVRPRKTNTILNVESKQKTKLLENRLVVAWVAGGGEGCKIGECGHRLKLKVLK